MRIKDCNNRDISFIKEVDEKIHKSQDKLNAVVTFCNVDEQLKDYHVEDTALLKNVPVILKDNINTKGTRTTASSRILDNYVPVYDATIVKKLRDAGAVFMAKASMDELGMGGTNLNAYTGKVNNPWDLKRITGGSSGGSAALVAAGLAPLAIGTDTGDSVRKPAAYCGVIGLKPTYGRISRYGIIPYASSLDHVGLFTTNVEDAAIALEVLSGRDDHDMTSSNRPVENYKELLNSDLNGKTIGIIQNVQSAIQNEAITSSFDALVKKLEEKGAKVVSVEFDQDLMNTLLPTYYVISNAEATANHSNLDGIRFGMREEGDDLTSIMINSRTKGFSSEVRKRFVIGSYSLFVENQEKIFRKAQRVRRKIVEHLDEKLEQCDILLASAAGSIAPYPEDSFGDKLSATHLVAENHMLLGNFSGYPSITVPSDMVENMPIAVNLLGKAFDEVTVLSVAKAIEEICAQDDVCKEVCE
ncbi:amidase family protein [Breznakia pachnodae]|uniref:Aspartyl-tRNA(Asn)/glutamyl-tRNA(Gln) amidotransferase subunit A n=1 Tax=Breznakia pachnodae TaxID=265178 RepID=A0ABU0E7D2_9FIRM|nr:amidase family protein [Breznakia pachnodae]MDQ0362797.1 aspartyl-tRNA(Asn)/glutamyl-tRNA(Gln) amidotransferase subunit A [Breznakia pachnodae]